MQELPGLKPDLFAKNEPLSRKKPNISLYESFKTFTANWKQKHWAIVF